MSVIPTPDERLLSAIPYIEHGATVADIGTDHAYLPIHLVRQGIAFRAVAADINRGPILSAEANIASAGLADHIQTVQTDGLHGIDAYAPDHILIFGMGGELIIRILEQAQWVKNKGITLILQPMSRVHLLRRWLNENGFVICGETLTDSAKFYQTICSRYNGVGEAYTEEELLLGRQNILSLPPLFEGFVRHEISVHQKIVNGKRKSADSDCTDELRVIAFLKKRLETIT